MDEGYGQEGKHQGVELDLSCWLGLVKDHCEHHHSVYQRQ